MLEEDSRSEHLCANWPVAKQHAKNIQRGIDMIVVLSHFFCLLRFHLKPQRGISQTPTQLTSQSTHGTEAFRLKVMVDSWPYDLHC